MYRENDGRSGSRAYMLINNGDVTRRFLSLRAGQFVQPTPVVVRRRVNEPSPQLPNGFFLDWWKSRFFFSLPFPSWCSTLATIRIFLVCRHVCAWNEYASLPVGACVRVCKGRDFRLAPKKRLKKYPEIWKIKRSQWFVILFVLPPILFVA